MMRRAAIFCLALLVLNGCASMPPRAREAAQERWNLARARFKAQVASDQLAAGRVAAAAGELAEAVELAPEAREWEPLRARVALARGDVALAESILQNVPPEQNENAEVAHLLGVVREQQQRWPDALAEYTRAMRLAPDDVGHVVAAVHAALQSGRADEAERILANTEERFSWSPAYQEALAEVLEQAGKWAESAAAWQRVVDEDPRDNEARRRLAIALTHADRCEDAIELLTGALDAATGPAAATMRVRLIECLLDSGQYRDALHQARTLIRESPSDARSHRLLAQAQAASGDDRAALASAHRALTLDTRDVPTLELVATLAWRTNERSLLTAALDQLDAVSPGNAVAVALRSRQP